MIRPLLLIFGIFTLNSCTEHKKQVGDFKFDASKVSEQMKYFYKYDSDKLMKEKEITYMLLFGQVVDSMIIETEYEYNDKQLLSREISKSDFEDKPTINAYEYDKRDSLICEISINAANDTTFWEVYEYYPDGKQIVFHRSLSMHWDQNQDFKATMESNIFDTLLYRNEFEYVGNLCKTQKQFDKKGNLIKSVNYEHSEERLIKEMHFIHFNDMTMMEMIKQYDYSKSEEKPDYFSLDSKNDTLQLCINEFSKGNLVKSTEIFDSGRNVVRSYYQNGMRIGMIGIDLNMNFKIYDSIEYYKSGEIKEIKTYNEELNNAH